MNSTTGSSHIAYRLQEDCQMLKSEDGLVVISPSFQVTIAHLHPDLCSIMMQLAEKTCLSRWIDETLAGIHQEDSLMTFYRYLSCLLRYQMLSIFAQQEGRETPLATLLPVSAYFHHRWVSIQEDRMYKISRFACIRRDDDGLNYVESPLSHARLRLESPIAALVLYHLSTATTPTEIAQMLPAGDLDDVISLLELLMMGNFVSSTTGAGRIGEDDDDALMQWEFHDLLFHSRSRIGRHNAIVGGSYRFLQRIPPLPAVKSAQWPVILSLPRPDMRKICRHDPSLADVMEARASIRHGEHSITMAQLGEFLYRVARVKETYHTEETGDLTTRPYPGGGASYEMEFYLAIDHCEDLAPGLYWYDPLHHALSFVQQANEDTEKLLQDASQATGEAERPQILIILAARFQRVSWKYQSIAYALILKDVGAVYTTLYLVATAMGLAPCALGVGDSELFARIAGSDFVKETSVGEFIISGGGNTLPRHTHAGRTYNAKRPFRAHRARKRTR